ncbi:MULTISPECIES: hypothetical protein [unclassified Nocardioides]|uniref:hypothetical protein n=1 Tax=unclassified Nocardioides TaxID=2615069 RepID=UPI0009F0A07D|nr:MULTISPECIES: hypothetical protein [unclassified Nocardioides]GAW51808.1 hypothetical protein PD653B2_4157 [Nocardioides sp. PD653-B2]GAW57245.1 hypothetical protein PD653_4688 [Nocardioides sp. PD653]
MKKLAAGLIASALLVPGTATTAFAGPHDGYPGYIPTQSSSSVPKHAEPGKPFKVKAKLGVSSNGQPCQGTFVMKVHKAGGDVFRKNKDTDGDNKTFTVTLDKPGKYFIKIRFIPAFRSPCKGSHTIKSLTVS